MRPLADAISRDGHFLVMSDPIGFRVWDLNRPAAAPILLKGSQRDTDSGFAIRPGGRQFAVAVRDLKVYDLDSPAAEPVRLQGRDDLTECLFAGTGFRGLAAFRRGGEAVLWSTVDPEARPISLGGGKVAVTCMAVSPDGLWLMTGGQDRMTRVWELSTQVPARNVITLGGHRGPITAVAFSPDGRWLASGSEDGTVRLWDFAAKSTDLPFAVLAGHEKGVVCLAFSPDSRRLATGDAAAARLWDLATTRPAAETVIPNGHGAPVSQVAFDADRRWLITASDAVRAWVLPLDELLELARQTAGRNLTHEEWARYFPGQPYHKTFLQFDAP